jgi:hypothetical protein
MVHVKFQEVKLPVGITRACAKCGKRFSRHTTIVHTVNPFNKNPDGSVRTVPEIRTVQFEEADAWKAAPEQQMCRGCLNEGKA